MTLSDPWPGFQGHGIFEVEYLKPCLRDNVRAFNVEKYRAGLPVTDLDGPWPSFQGYGIFEVEYLKNSVS